MNVMNKLDHSLSPLERTGGKSGVYSYSVHVCQSQRYPTCHHRLYDSACTDDATGIHEGDAEEKENGGVLCSSHRTCFQCHTNLLSLQKP
jgi:hypothetical protein